MVPPWGGSQRREPPKNFFLRICNIFCMRETVYISYGFRMRADPLGPQNALKTKIYLWAFPPNLFLFFWGALGAMVPWCHSGAMTVLSDTPAPGTAKYRQVPPGTPRYLRDSRGRFRTPFKEYSIDCKRHAAK